MSRRTKLLFLAVFLVLLAIPAAYVALTWHPAFPLRFHLESIDEKLVEDDPRYRSLRIRVENASSIPIQFHGGSLLTNFPTDVFSGPEGFLMPCQYSYSHNNIWWSDESLIIPAHGTLHIRGAIGSKVRTIPQGGEISIQCRWETSTHARAARAVNWIRDSNPQWGTGRLPRIDHHRTTVPLELKGYAPASPSEPSVP